MTMSEASSPAPASKTVRWSGRIMVALPVLMMLMSATFKFLQTPEVVKGFEHLGWNLNLVTTLGILQVACTVLYAIPRTAVLGAILLTGYLGGAIATSVRVGDGWVFQFLFGIVLWGGLYLRDPRLRALIPLVR